MFFCFLLCTFVSELILWRDLPNLPTRSTSTYLWTVCLCLGQVILHACNHRCLCLWSASANILCYGSMVDSIAWCNVWWISYVIPDRKLVDFNLWVFFRVRRRKKCVTNPHKCLCWFQEVVYVKASFCCLIYSISTSVNCVDRLCGLVVRVSGYRYRGPGFNSRCYQIFWVVVGLERGPLSLVRSIEELLE